MNTDEDQLDVSKHASPIIKQPWLEENVVNNHVQAFVDHRPNRSMKGPLNADARWTEV